MTRLLLDLKHYDEGGRVKPGAAVLWLLVFLCRSLWVFIIALSIGPDGDTLLRLFYPKDAYLYVGMLIGLPALAGYLIIAFREKLAKHAQLWPFYLIRYLLLSSCLLDLFYQCYLANRYHWQFSWPIAVFIVLNIWVAFFVFRDRHLRVLIADWVRH